MQQRTRTMVMIAVAAVALIGIERAQSTPPTAGVPGRAALGSPIGRVVDDGSLAFKVNKIDCSVPLIGTPKLGARPNPGFKFCLVSVAISDIGENEIAYYDAYQDVFTKNGARYGYNVGAAYWLKADRDGTHLNSGMTIAAEVPFEIPKSTAISLIEFHEDAFSRGALVRA